MSLYTEKIEALINAALADGVLTEKEKQILFKKAQEEGIDLDEFEMVLDGRLVDLQKKAKNEAKKAAPKSDKFGDVRKCPSCGAIIPAFQGACPECGYEFSGLEANLSSKKLAEELKKSKTSSEQKIIIETFPIPNTKGDLLEFLTSLKPKMMDFSDPLSSSYFKKYEECISKSELSFSDDKMFSSYLTEFPAIKKKWSKQYNAVMIKRTISEFSLSEFIINHLGVIILSVAAIIAIWAGISGISNAIERSRKANVVKEQYQHLKEAYDSQDYSKAVSIMIDIPSHSDSKKITKILNENRSLENDLFDTLLENKCFNEAESLVGRNKDYRIALIKALIDDKRYQDAERLTTYGLLSVILDYCVETENIAAGRTIIGEKQYSTFHDFLRKYTTNLCQKKKISLASQVVAKNISYFNSLKFEDGFFGGNKSQYEAHNTTAVRNELNSIINSYK